MVLTLQHVISGMDDDMRRLASAMCNIFQVETAPKRSKGISGMPNKMTHFHPGTSNAHTGATHFYRPAEVLTAPVFQKPACCALNQQDLPAVRLHLINLKYHTLLPNAAGADLKGGSKCTTMQSRLSIHELPNFLAAPCWCIVQHICAAPHCHSCVWHAQDSIWKTPAAQLALQA